MARKTEWNKNCPGCNDIQYYSSKYELKSAITHNRLCRSCSWGEGRRNKHSSRMSGKDNPFYGKTHSMEVIDILKNIDKSYTRTDEYRKNMSKSTTGEKNGMYGKTHKSETLEKIRDKALNRKPTDEARKNMRLAWINKKKWIDKNGGQFSPGYNPDACKLIDEYGKKHGYNFQHAENGGEYHIKELGYWVDGYDKEHNVIIEYYEKAHKNTKERDERRKQEIVELLECKFIEMVEK